MKKGLLAASASVTLLLSLVRPAAAVPDFNLPAVQLRITLGRVLAEHAFLTVEAMRTGIEQSDAFTTAAEALEANTVEIVGLIETVYGADAGDAFGDLWRAHIGYVVDYTRALSGRDTAGQQSAIEQLRAYTQDIAELLAGANPNLTVDAVRGLIEDHVQQLEQVAALAQGNYARAYGAVRETYAHMFVIGDGLSAAIAAQFPDRFGGADVAFGPAVDLAVGLHHLFGEHALLAILSTRAGLTEAPDVAEAVSALDSNSTDLTAAIAGIYGQDAAAGFDALWRRHTGFYLDYVNATREDDTSAQAAAAEGLAEYRADFSSFLAGANPNLTAPALEDLLGTHISHLVAQVDSYAAEDYDAAYATTREAYGHMGTLATAFGRAISAQFPDRFPNTGAWAPPSSVELPVMLGVVLFGTWLVTRATYRSRARRLP